MLILEKRKIIQRLNYLERRIVEIEQCEQCPDDYLLELRLEFSQLSTKLKLLEEELNGHNQ